jgi:diamine N-acetyltransferase
MLAEAKGGIILSVELRPISKENYRACMKLTVREDQKDFVAPNIVSLVQAHYEGNLIPMGVYAGESMVGFIMFEENNGENGHRFIWRLMVDAEHQGKGYGKAVMQKALDFLSTKEDCREIWLSFEPENKGAEKLYLSLGFEHTGEMLDNEVCMRYRVVRHLSVSS